MADPITAHGWRATRASSSLVTTNRLSYLVVAPTRLCGDDEGPPDEAFAGLISCVEDAARLAEVRDVLTRWDADVDADDTATLDRLLALLSGDGTP